MSVKHTVAVATKYGQLITTLFNKMVNSSLNYMCDKLTM